MRTVLALLCGVLEDTRMLRWQIMIAVALGLFVHFNSPQPVELLGTHGCTGAALSQEVVARATGHITALKLPCAKRWELAPWDAWQHPSYPEPGLGS
jgi:hypothetical protein